MCRAGAHQIGAFPRWEPEFGRLPRVALNNCLLPFLTGTIRVLERAKDFGARFIELARSVDWTNDERAELKRLINELVGSTYVEVKEYVDYR